MGKLMGQKGASLTEFGIVVGLVVAVAVGAIVGTGTKVQDIFKQAGSALGDPSTLSSSLASTPVSDNEDPELVEEPVVAGFGATIVLSGVTSLSLDVFADTQEPDMLMAFVMHRSALSAPSGWEEVVSVRNETNEQWTTLLTKPFVSDDLSGVTFTQSSSNRMVGQILTIRGTNPQITEVLTSSGGSGNSRLPAYFADQEDGLVLAATSDVYSTSSNATISAPEGWVQTTPETIPDNRLAIAWNKVEGSQAGFGQKGVIFTDSVNTDIWSALQVQVTANGAVVPEGEIYDDYDIGPGFTVLTENDDTYELSTSEEGVLALAGNDVLTGTDSSETFIPGPGDDTVTMGKGDDLYIFSKGDGADYVINYDYGGSEGTLSFTDYASTELTFINSGDDDLTISGESGDRLVIRDQLDDDHRDGFVTFEMTDVIYSRAQLRDRVVEDMKPSGVVVGTRHVENYYYSAGDGSYSITDYHYNRNRTDTITFVGINSSDAVFSNAGSDNMSITIGGDVITIKGTLDPDRRNDIETFIFDDVTMTFDDARDKMVEDMKSSGVVTGSPRQETYYYTPGDGSYVLTDYDYQRDDTDEMIVSANLNDFTFFANTGDDVTFRHDSTGDEIRIVDLHENDRRHDIESFVFTDGTRTLQDVRDKIVEDMKEMGSVVGSERLDNYYYRANDGSYTIIDYDYYRDDVDTMTFVGLNFDEMYVTNPNNNGIRFIHIASGDQITIEDMQEDSRRYDIDSFIFADGTRSVLDIRNKMVSDMKSIGSGTVRGTERLENYFHTSGDGSYTIYDYDYDRDDQDSLTFTDIDVGDIVFSRSGDNLVMALPGSETVTVSEQFASNNRYALETITFADGTVWGDRSTIAANVP